MQRVGEQIRWKDFANRSSGVRAFSSRAQFWVVYLKAEFDCYCSHSSREL